MTDLYGLMNDDGDLETVKLHCVTLRKEGRNRKLRTVYTISVPNEVVIHLWTTPSVGRPVPVLFNFSQFTIRLRKLNYT